MDYYDSEGNFIGHPALSAAHGDRETRRQYERQRTRPTPGVNGDRDDSCRTAVSNTSVATQPSILESLRHVPSAFEATQRSSFVYFLLDVKERLVYIGQTESLRRRIVEHRDDKDFARVYAVPVPTILVDRVEGALIRHYQMTRGYNANGGGGDAARDAMFLDAFRSGRWNALLDEFSGESKRGADTGPKAVASHAPR